MKTLPFGKALVLGSATMALAFGRVEPSFGQTGDDRCRNIDQDHKPGVSVAISASTNITRATTDKNALSASVSFDNYRNPTACGPRRQQTNLSLSASYEDKHPEGKSLSITRSHEATLQHQVFLGGNSFYLAANARGFHNTDLGMYLMQRYSGLVGTLFTKGIVTQELFAGPAYVAQRFLTNPTTGIREPSRSYPAIYAGELGAIELAQLDSARVVVLSHAFWATVPLEDDDPNALNTRAQAALHLPLTSRFAVIVQATNEYLRNAPPGFNEHFFNASLGFSVSLGNQ